MLWASPGLSCYFRRESVSGIVWFVFIIYQLRKIQVWCLWQFTLSFICFQNHKHQAAGAEVASAHWHHLQKEAQERLTGATALSSRDLRELAAAATRARSHFTGASQWAESSSEPWRSLEALSPMSASRRAHTRVSEHGTTGNHEIFTSEQNLYLLIHQKVKLACQGYFPVMLLHLPEQTNVAQPAAALQTLLAAYGILPR